MQNIDHSINKKLTELPFRVDTFLVAYSGGLDSAVLLHLLSKWKKAKVVLAHIHHGDFDNKKYRDEMQNLATRTSEKYQIEMRTFKVSEHLKTEAALRDARYAALKRWQSEYPYSLIVTAHHKDDLLETRLLKLIRGTGANGLSSFGSLSQHVWRPLLDVSKAELFGYAQNEGIEYGEDPTNQETDMLRNWIRQSWLPDLEARMPGAVSAMARSFDNIVADFSAEPTLLESHNINCGEALTQGVSLVYFESLSSKGKRSLIAGYLLKAKKRDFSQSQIEEIIKRLDTSQKVHTFSIAGLVWSVNAGRVKVLD